MPKEDNKILKYKHGENFVKVLFIIYPDLESWLKSATTKTNKHHLLAIPCLHNVHLMYQKESLIVINLKIV